MVVHKGKPNESARPNLYRDSFPPEKAKYLPFSEVKSPLRNPVKQEDVQKFFADLREEWRRNGLLKVDGPETAQQVQRTSKATWGPAGITVQQALTEHSDWGSDMMAQQLYCEQRGLDIGVIEYMQEKEKTENRGDGSSLGPVRRLIKMWFPHVMQSVQTWQEIFVVTALNDDTLDDWILAAFESLDEAHCVPPFEFPSNGKPNKQGLDRLRGDIKALTDTERKRKLQDVKILGPILMTIPASNLAAIVMHELMGFLVSGRHEEKKLFGDFKFKDDKKFVQAAIGVGRSVHVEWSMSALKNVRSRFQVNKFQVAKAAKTRDIRKLKAMMERVFRAPNFDDESLLAKIGSLLISLMMQSSRFSPSLLLQGNFNMKAHELQSDFRLAISHEIKFRGTRVGGRMTGLLMLAPGIKSALQDQHEFTANLSPLLLPMVVPPLKWQAFDRGW